MPTLPAASSGGPQHCVSWCGSGLYLVAVGGRLAALAAPPSVGSASW